MRRDSSIVFFLAVLCAFLAPAQSAARNGAQSGTVEVKQTGRAIEMRDVIEMTRLGDHDYFTGRSAEGRVALFSPDGSAFVVLLRKGNVVCDTNEFSLLLYKTADALLQTKPDLLLTMASSSNRDAIRQVRWLADNERIAFLGEKPGEPSEVYLFNVRTRRLQKLTDHATAITGYDMTPDASTLLFEADVPQFERTRHQEALVEGQNLVDLIAGHDALSLRSQEVFLQAHGQAEVGIPVATEDYFLYPESQLSLAPTGSYGLLSVIVRNIPELWKEYPDVKEQTAYLPKRELSHVRMYLVYDAQKKSVAPLVNAPGGSDPRWAANGRTVFVRTRLPLDVADAAERKARVLESFNARIDLPGGEIAKVRVDELPEPQAVVAPLDVTLEEDANHPPKIFAADRKNQAKAQLLDLNPQFANLRFGPVETIEWNVGKGLRVQGGLYLPPDYVRGKRYPLVIQTHGFNPARFSMDGLQEWSSAFAARLLAEKGIVVLQAFNFLTRQDHDHYNDGHRFGNNISQAGIMVGAVGFEAAIDYLDQRGVIDRSKVGIVGFSRTVCSVAYLLTHTSYRFAAASMVDGIDCGYFQEISAPSGAWDFRHIMGDTLPFGEGLQQWLKESPSFSLDKVNTPVKLLALAPWEVLEQWEWYAGLSLQGKPVEYTFLPDEFDGDNHLLTKPWERAVAGEGLVDWFCFWLQGREDRDEAKSAQYARWRRLREQLASSKELRE